MATARITGGFGVAPGFGTVTNTKPKKPTALAGGFGNSIQSSLANHPTFTPQTPAASKPAASSPAGGPSVQKIDFNNLPVDPVYDKQVGALGKTRDDIIAGLEGQKTATLADYGYGATYDDNGDVSGLTIDPNNPYSRASQLQKSFDQAKTGTTNSYAASGQLYSGAIQNAQDTNATNFNMSSSNMRKSLGAILAGIIGGERTAKTDYSSGEATAYGDRIGRVGDNPLYSPTDPSSGQPGAAPAATPAGPSTADLIKQWVGNPVKTTYTNPQGHPVRVYGDGHKEVSTDGGRTWKRV